MQQQLPFALDQLLQLCRAKCLLYISSAVTLMQSALSIHTAAYVLYQQHNPTAEVSRQMYVLSVGCFVATIHTKRTVT